MYAGKTTRKMPGDLETRAIYVSFEEIQRIEDAVSHLMNPAPACGEKHGSPINRAPSLSSQS